ncbi:protocatechuate 3,4-dioxygenase subunit alpha [Paraburkholderia megapolitana]|uniref:Protocatechuate 3,4-dioxygenase, alpha subunit n=1 Tax=Paraburkholderia megapolitana TaxID=420953 RepID=A0A1I3EL95_9BURK|nr:protocatechuate 3,4-dioxygenase subunit alpha [Paraburkholderia megapolitana]QDQ80134.1 protocatechuate 3,4-dioxygenase subunit alpha [Paraburkholderia megapolitana]SFH99491.1 protocatechuate 3,4-dioxygenase, alpha subunit [Paraburkholderia megapolitana]
MTTLKQTPSQTVGPYFAYGLCPQQYDFDFGSLFTATLADREAKGEHITIVGQVFDGNGEAIFDAMLEISQVDSEGRYPASRKECAESGFRGFARVGTGTDLQRRFIVDTVKPGRVSADEAPHLNVVVTMRGMLLHTFTRLYFDDEAAANERDAVLLAVPAERRATLIARRESGTGNAVYRFDIHMQGENETVFFDL